MIRWMSVAVVVCSVAGCSSTTNPASDTSPPETGYGSADGKHVRRRMALRDPITSSSSG